MKKELIPAILEKRFQKIEKLVLIAEKTELKMVQIDICDGNLTPSKTFISNFNFKSFQKIKNISSKINYELDIIADLKNKEDKILNSILEFSPKKVIFHNRGVLNWDKIFSIFRKKTDIALGIWLDDDNLKIKKLLQKYPFDYIQIMGIEKVGFGGQKLSQKVYKKIKYFKEKFPKLPIQIDGGVKLENVSELSKAGVSYFVSGSGFYGAKDLKKRLNDFKKKYN